MSELPDFDDRPIRDLYLYARLPVPIEQADPWFERMAEEAPDVSWRLLALAEDVDAWADGIVASASYRGTPYELARELAGPLGECVAWAIHSDTEWVDFPPAGPITRFFEAPSPEPGSRHLRIFIQGPEGKHLESAAEAISGAMKAHCAPVFWFRDGSILFTRSREPLGIVGPADGPPYAKPEPLACR